MSPIGVWAILVAGGSGNRYAKTKSKLLEPVAGKAVLARSYEVLTRISEIQGIVIVYHPDWEKQYRHLVATFATKTPTLWTHGGASRRESVWHGLQVLPQEASIVLIHDAARPLVSQENIRACLQPVLAEAAKGTTLGIPAQNTLKKVALGETPWVTETLDRSQLWQIHTPQVFQRSVLMKAHQQILHDPGINDDAELVERLFPGQRVVLMVPDEPTNIKITTPQDLQLAEAFLNAQSIKLGPN